MVKSLIGASAKAVIDSWRPLLVNGEKHQIDQFLEELERRFGTLGWKRDLIYESKLNDPHQINHLYCWRSDFDNRRYVRLCLNRATDRRVYGSTYDYHDQQGGVDDLASAILRVFAEVLEPAAAANGLKVTYPHLGPISCAGTRTEAAMTELADTGAGQWPLLEKVAPVWRAFVNTAYREEVAIKPEELTAWFIDSGWDAEASAELTNRFYSDVAILDEYEEAGRQAPWR